MPELGLPRLERAFIIGSSAGLPRALRIRNRRRRLARWHMKLARHSDLLFVRHPKTGGTWLRTLLTRLYANKYGLPSNRVVRYDELHRSRPELPRLLTTSGALWWERELGDIIGRDPELREKKLLFLARHPIDVTTSWYNQLRKRTSAFKRELILSELEFPIDLERISRIEFALHPELGLPRVIEYHNHWWRNAARLRHSLVLRYEDLRADTQGELKRLTDFLGEEFSAAHVEEAVDFAAVENMRKLERSGYFRNKGLRMRDPDDPETHKVRRARVGGYREDFEPADAARLEAMLRERLMPELGYAGQGP